MTANRNACVANLRQIDGAKDLAAMENGLSDGGSVDTYVGGTLEAGGVWQDAISLDDTIIAGSVFLGTDTVIGSMYLAYGHAEGGHQGVYLFLGRPWFRF